MKLSEKSEISRGTRGKEENEKKKEMTKTRPADGDAAAGFSEAEGATSRNTWIDWCCDTWSKHSEIREPLPRESTV